MLRRGMAPVVAGVAFRRIRDERIHAEGTCTHEDATCRLPLGIALDARVADRRAIRRRRDGTRTTDKQARENALSYPPPYTHSTVIAIARSLSLSLSLFSPMRTRTRVHLAPSHRRR